MTVMARYENNDETTRARPNRVREASPAYLAPAPLERPQAYAVTMADRGRLVLPAEIRARLDIKEGDRLTLVVDPDGSIHLLTAKAFIARLRGAFKHLAPGRSLVDELIAERRREAAKEQREWQRDLARRPKTRG